SSLWRRLYRHVPLSCHPSRGARAARYARDDLWLEPGNADARRSGRSAHPGGPGFASTAPGRCLQGFGNPHGHAESAAVHRSDFRAGCVRTAGSPPRDRRAESSHAGVVMKPNPLSDVLHFLVQPSWTTGIYWLLAIGSIGIALYAWTTIESQRSMRNV